jgi:hypothetical protein
MQAAIGMIEVKRRVKKIKKMSEARLRKYVQCRPIPLVIGPGASGAAQFYMTDHHHLARALLDAKKSSAQCIVQESHAGLPESQFRDLMIEERKVRLLDENGQEIPWQRLPNSLAELRDDPYRSLAWKVEKEEGFYKPCSDFGEFVWADFFRTHGSDGKPGAAVATPAEIKTNFDDVTELATKLAKSEAAKDLPGYKRNPEPHCPAAPPGCGDDE